MAEDPRLQAVKNVLGMLTDEGGKIFSPMRLEEIAKSILYWIDEVAMQETTLEKLARLKMMVEDQGKWDLSRNDVLAIEKALDLIKQYVPEKALLEE